MGGAVDSGVRLRTKISPHRAAIEKAQAELRQECDVKEKWKRELEFLERGGNPLDFKFGHAASTSLHSTSFTDQQAEQCAISEAKGSFVLIASRHGDSIESSGRPGESVKRETNTADNLVLFDGENSVPSGVKNLKRKRGNASLLEQTSEGAGCTHTKGTEDSLIFHLGVKNQAYTRRNRSRTSRDGHGNKSSTSSTLGHSDGNGPVREAHTDKDGASYVSNSISKGNDLSKTSSTGCKLDMELDVAQKHHSSVNVIKDRVLERKAELNISENTNQSNTQTSSHVEQAAKDQATSVDFQSVAHEATGNVSEKVNDLSVPDKNVTGVLCDDPNSKLGTDSLTEIRRLIDVQTDTQTKKENMTSVNATSEKCSMLRHEEGNSDGECKEGSPYQKTTDNKGASENGLSTGVEALITAVPSNPSNSTIHIKDEIELSDDRIEIVSTQKSLKSNGEIVSETQKILNNSLGDSSHSTNNAGGAISCFNVLAGQPSTTTLSERGISRLSTASEVQSIAANHLKLEKKAHEDAILKEARVIKANLKRTAQLSSYKSSEKQQKSHWDFVLEEMAWMANDFMQERLWKTAAAAHISHSIASSGHSEFVQNIIYRKQRNIARTLAKAVMHFWHSADVSRTTGEALNCASEGCNSDLFESCKVNGEDGKAQDNEDVDAGNITSHTSIQGYAVRFLKYDCATSTHSVLAEPPSTPDRVNDAGRPETSCESDISEESLFYTVPPGAMQVYRDTVESQWLNYEKMVNHMNHEDCEASRSGFLLDGPLKNEYEEEEGETGSYLLPGAVEGIMSSKLTLKRKKIFPQKYVARSFNVGSDFSFDSHLEGKSANIPLMTTGRRPRSTPNSGLIPIKRVRTATRQRVPSPFGAGVTGSLNITNKADVSIGDTNSLQDDQGSMHGGSQPKKNMDIESTVDFERQFLFDSSETSTKPKKKKSKHFGYCADLSASGVLVVSRKGSAFDQRLQADLMIQQEQRDQIKSRLEDQHDDSNGNIATGIYGQHAAKKPKLLKQLTYPAQEAIMPATGSVSSPVASQTSNMSSQYKFIKIITNRDQGKKSKTTKMAAGQSDSGTSWTNFEDQALVVFVHDMGPNWELVSDAINSTLQFKCIFRKPKECKDRHKYLMEKSAGDGADSAEDSGTSQPYPSTIPGIPKGSAIQLFQHLQGPIEEDTLKAHFEKLVLIGQKLHSFRNQKNTQELKQITLVHSSHFVALSQTCPNNLGGGILSPLDLCDAITSSPDVALGCQGSNTSGAAIPTHQVSPSPSLPTSNASTMSLGSSGIVPGSNLPSPSTPLNPPARDTQRYFMHRAASLPVDDQQKMHYAPVLSGRNNQQASMAVPGSLPVGVDQGIHMLSTGNGMGMMGGRTMPMSRPGFQPILSQSMPMVSSGGMLASCGGVPNPVNTHPSTLSGPENSMLRPQPGQNTEDHRQMTMQEIPLHISQGNGQLMPPFSAMSTQFSTITRPSSLSSYQAQKHQQSYILGNPNHTHIQGMNRSSPQLHSYAIRLAKERQLQQRLMPQVQQPYSAVQSSSQLQQQPQPSSSSLPFPAKAQHNKQQMQSKSQGSPGLSNQVMKQRQQQQQQQQQLRLRQQHKQQLQQQAELVKGVGGGSMLIHENLTFDPSQVSDKPLIQMERGFFPGSSGLNSAIPQSSNQHKSNYGLPSQSSNQISPHPLNPLSAPTPPQLQHQINQNTQRMMQQSGHLSSDGRVKSSGDQVQVHQMIPTTSLPISTSSAPLMSSSTQRKTEPSHDVNSPTPTTHLTSSPSGGTDLQTRDHWQLQQQSQSQLQLQQQQKSQHPHGQGMQGNKYARPSKLGSG
ncbi:chromatin modification-related protein EAF1 B-like isoform X2 [Asparagus officinalis]|uniref:chromatin modification-related protein EAF1 B-like isoform X2 n=1 Tax=Asparagus officinalis TaxID=4686 RepID=UPI00098E3689|nr:chromatin modification-related protein EAF1 B-like isoform X2 [Asparagus officinalis]